MNNTGEYRQIEEAQIDLLCASGCTCTDWSRVYLEEGFDASRIINVRFSGDIRIARQNGTIRLFGGIERPAGIYNAVIHNCRIGRDVFISNVENYIANYNIGDDVIISHISLLAVDGVSAFGNGTKAAVINESGSREIAIYDNLTSQIAYMLAMYRHKLPLIEKLMRMIDDYVESVKSDRGTVGSGAKITNAGILANLRIGENTVIDGTARLENGSINSCPEDPPVIGTDVIARDFIVCSGARITDGTVLSKCFVGQAADLSKHYSAENSVFFANCGGYHGEACSVFAGPYTVTHHKSTLLIAGLYSFLNAGSGSNQSNHMYKLGPLHQGIVERGSKTTSDSYMLWPARVGAFSMVMGRHYGNSDTSELPFSYIIESNDESVLIPGVCLRNVGTVRDSRKWPKRDKRKDPRKMDLIIFNLLTPYTVQKMIKGMRLLEELKSTSGKTSQNYYYNSVKIKKSSLENGIRYYRMGLHRYLGNIMVSRLMNAGLDDTQSMRRIFTGSGGEGKGKWLDIAGLIVPKSAVDNVVADIESGKIDNQHDLTSALRELHDNFELYQWQWVLNALEYEMGKPAADFTPADVAAMIEKWIDAVHTLDEMRIADACKEYSSSAKTGFGADGSNDDKNADFLAVRGNSEDNDFVKDMRERLQRKMSTAENLIQKLKIL